MLPDRKQPDEREGMLSQRYAQGQLTIAEGIAGRPAGSILGSTWRQCYVGVEGARELRNGYCSMLASRGCRKSMEERWIERKKETGFWLGDAQSSACFKSLGCEGCHACEGLPGCQK